MHAFFFGFVFLGAKEKFFSVILSMKFSSLKFWGCESTCGGQNELVSIREGLFQAPHVENRFSVFYFFIILQKRLKNKCGNAHSTSTQKRPKANQY